MGDSGEAGGAIVMTRQHFDIQLGRLIVLRNWPDDVTEWWNALREIDPAVFEAACAQALKTRTFFPMPAELRSDCDAVKSHVRRDDPESGPLFSDLEEARTVEICNPFDSENPIRLKVVRVWRHDCETCGDTGWSSRQCPEASCGRRFEHDPHEFVEPCVCLEWNPTIRRRKEAAVKYHQKPAAA